MKNLHDLGKETTTSSERKALFASNVSPRSGNRASAPTRILLLNEKSPETRSMWSNNASNDDDDDDSVAAGLLLFRETTFLILLPHRLENDDKDRDKKEEEEEREKASPAREVMRARVRVYSKVKFVTRGKSGFVRKEQNV